MEIAEWSVIQNTDGAHIEEMLFTYNDNEKQENEINKANAKLVFSPKFIPFYPNLFEKWLTHIQILIFWFIDFYVSNAKEWRFYFTNEQLGKILNLNEQTVSNNVWLLEKSGMININRKMRSWWGQIRFIEIKNQLQYNYSSNYNQTNVATITKPLGNNNKINNNKIKELFVSFWKSYPHVRKSKKKEAESNYKKNDISDSDVAFEIKLLSRELTFWIQDTKYVPAFERWIRDIVPTNEIARDHKIKQIIYKLMEYVWEKRIEYSNRLKQDFWEDIVKKYSKMWNKDNNWIALHFRK